MTNNFFDTGTNKVHLSLWFTDITETALTGVSDPEYLQFSLFKIKGIYLSPLWNSRGCV